MHPLPDEGQNGGKFGGEKKVVWIFEQTDEPK